MSDSSTRDCPTIASFCPDPLIPEFKSVSYVVDVLQDRREQQVFAVSGRRRNAAYRGQVGLDDLRIARASSENSQDHRCCESLAAKSRRKRWLGRIKAKCVSPSTT